MPLPRPSRQQTADGPRVDTVAATARGSENIRRYQVCHERNVTIGPSQAEDLWNFYSRFVDCSRDRFMSAIAQADELYQLRGPQNDLLGFAALRTIEIQVDGERRRVLYVLYTDLEERLRGLAIVHRLAVGRYLRFRLRHPFLPTYVAFSASTAASYLSMAQSLQEYWPRPGRETPPEIKRIVEAALHRCGIEGWDPERGVLRRHGQLRYRDSGQSDVRPTAHAEFYRIRNPEQQYGDSLICLFPVNCRNALAAIRTMIRLALRRNRANG